MRALANQLLGRKGEPELNSAHTFTQSQDFRDAHTVWNFIAGEKN